MLAATIKERLGISATHDQMLQIFRWTTFAQLPLGQLLAQIGSMGIERDSAPTG